MALTPTPKKPRETFPLRIAGLVAIAGASATGLASYNTYLTVKGSATTTGATAVSYISTWNCKKAHEILSQLTFHRLRDINAGSHGHTESTDDLVVGTLNASTNTISDYHSLRGSATQALRVITDLAEPAHQSLSQALNHLSHDSGKPIHAQRPNGDHSDTVSTSNKVNVNNIYTGSKSTILASTACEQLSHGVNASGVDVYDIPAKDARQFAQDFREGDRWILFMYGPWAKQGSQKFAFALAKLNPSYITIGSARRSLDSIMPKGAGVLKVTSNTVKNSNLETTGGMLRSFPSIYSSSDLDSLRLLPFRNSTISLLSSAEANNINSFAIGSAGIVAFTGLALTAGMFLLSKKIESNQKEMQETLERESKIDPLTRLFNRRAWDLSLDKAEDLRREQGACFAIVAIDLNEFKKINDTQGHIVGDEVLKDAASAILTHTRDVDICARVGGDEFAILSPINNIDKAQELVSRLRKEFNSVKIKAAFGYSITSSKQNIYNAWAKADEEMYQDKSLRKSLEDRISPDQEGTF